MTEKVGSELKVLNEIERVKADEGTGVFGGSVSRGADVTGGSASRGSDVTSGSASNGAMLVYENTLPAEFVRRLNRFSAEVLIDGEKETVHVKNTGRLGELLLPGAKVTLQRAANPDRKTAYDLISVYKKGLEWVNIDSLAPNILVRRYLEGMDYYDVVKPEFKIGDSRIDFYMEHGGVKYLSEVKGCTLASETEPGIGLFPDAPTERGIKHLHELAKAAQEGYRCSVDFVIQMNGIKEVHPNNATHPEFGSALCEAAQAGVKVNCLRCRVEADRIKVVDTCLVHM